MTKSNDTTTVEVVTAETARAAIKDAGRVRMGGGMIQFSDVAASREATKDAGRVHVGGGMMRF